MLTFLFAPSSGSIPGAAAGTPGLAFCLPAPDLPWECIEGYSLGRGPQEETKPRAEISSSHPLRSRATVRQTGKGLNEKRKVKGGEMSSQTMQEGRAPAFQSQ